MMNNPYELHSWSKHYREERLAEARCQNLARCGVSRLTPVSLWLVMLVLVAILLGASACTDSASSSISSDTDASRYAGMRSSGSWECYTFYSDGTVELRHGGTSAVNDTGSYQGEENVGEIVWDSGRWTSTVVAEGDGLIIDDLKVSPVESCF
jgi:hypothetical protein